MTTAVDDIARQRPSTIVVLYEVPTPHRRSAPTPKPPTGTAPMPSTKRQRQRQAPDRGSSPIRNNRKMTPNSSADILDAAAVLNREDNEFEDIRKRMAEPVRADRDPDQEKTEEPRRIRAWRNSGTTSTPAAAKQQERPSTTDCAPHRPPIRPLKLLARARLRQRMNPVYPRQERRTLVRRFPPPPTTTKAASALEPSGPPACAMSGLLLLPCRPSPGRFPYEARRRNRAMRSVVTPTTMLALPSSLVVTRVTMPEPSCFLPSSAEALHKDPDLDRPRPRAPSASPRRSSAHRRRHPPCRRRPWRGASWCR